ncbi:MAG: hypothetical protein J7494_12030 [Sphingobium sp.]|nr:hypothetical protein [Sphingobium sp.]
MLAALTLSACGEVVPPPRPASFTPATPRPSTPLQAAPAPQANGVIGVDARALIKLLGEPRLDIRDPAARKLQFSDGRCILDAYLYPARDRKEPVVTYAEARKSDGTQMDWTACASQLRSR